VTLVQLNPLQQAIFDVVSQYPGKFSRSGLAKMLVGAKSWQDTNFPEYGRFSHYRRKDIANQIEIMLQQEQLHLDGHSCLILAVPGNNGRSAVRCPVCHFTQVNKNLREIDISTACR
jgi:hypothetical protein